ncbi:hypothetical protein MMG03_002169 [Fibrobacter succinogenes]|nr:hypothetical protein [Fibrobacter succinogenes]
MGADHSALTALNASIRIPGRDVESQVALFVLGCAGGEYTVNRHLGNGKLFAVALDDFCGNFVNECRSVAVDRSAEFLGAGNSGRNLDFEEVSQRSIDSVPVLLDHFHTLLGVGLFGILLDVLDSGIGIENVTQLGEEAGLHHSVDATAHASLCGHCVCVDDVHLELLLDDDFLNRTGESIPNGFCRVRGVDQEGCALLCILQHVDGFEMRSMVASNEVSFVFTDQVRSVDDALTETEVRSGHGTRLLGVVYEVTLSVVFGFVTDNLDGVLVCANGTVGAQTEEHGLEEVGIQLEVRIDGEAGVADIVVDTNGETCAGCVQLQFVEDSLDHSRGEFLGGKTVAATDHLGHSHLASHDGFRNCGKSVLEERFACGTRFLAAVENSDLLDGLGESSNNCFHGERTVQTNVYETDLFALGVEILNGVTDGAGRRAHGDDDAFCIGCTHVVNNVILTTGEGSNLVHVLLDDFRNLLVEGVHGFAALEVDVRVLGGTAHGRAVRSEAAFAASLHVLFVDDATDNAVFESFDLHDFVRSTETVEEVNERDAGFKSRSVSHESHVLAFLNGGRAEHSETGLAASHDVGVVTENRKALHSKSTGSHMEDRGGQFAGDLVHVGDHQQKTLGCGKGGGQSTGLQCTVNGTGSATFGLHFKNAGNLAPNILLTSCAPVVGVFSHRTRRCNRVDSCNFTNCKSNVSGSFITVTRNHLLCHVCLQLLC